MRVIPNSATSRGAQAVDQLTHAIHEFNHCHGPSDGKFCSTEGGGGAGGDRLSVSYGGISMGTVPGPGAAARGARQWADGQGSVPQERRAEVDAAFQKYVSGLKGAKQRYAAHVADRIYNNLPAGPSDGGTAPGEYGVSDEDGLAIRVKLVRMSFGRDLPKTAKPKAEKAPAGPPIAGLSEMPLHQIAGLIRRNWGAKTNYAAKPYLDALGSLTKISDNYIHDSGHSIVAYFLGNATSWRGDVAKQVKKELNRRLKNK